MLALKIYAAYFAQFLKARLEYKFSFIAALITSAVSAVMGLLFIVLLLDGDSITHLGDWSRDQILLIYGYSLISVALFSCVAINLYGFGDRYIIQGQFDRILLRPLNSICQVIFESFNLDSLGTAAVGLFVFFRSANRLGIALTLIDYAWLLVSSICGATILLAVFVAVASVSFHFEDRFGIAPPIFNMMGFSRYPLPIYHWVVQFILKWIIPFAFVAFFPATHFLSRKEFAWFCYSTPLMTIAICLFAAALWRLGVRKYSSTGS